MCKTCSVQLAWRERTDRGQDANEKYRTKLCEQHVIIIIIIRSLLAADTITSGRGYLVWAWLVLRLPTSDWRRTSLASASRISYGSWRHNLMHTHTHTTPSSYWRNEKRSYVVHLKYDLYYVHTNVSRACLEGKGRVFFFFWGGGEDLNRRRGLRPSSSSRTRAVYKKHKSISSRRLRATGNEHADDVCTGRLLAKQPPPKLNSWHAHVCIYTKTLLLWRVHSTFTYNILLWRYYFRKAVNRLPPWSG